MTIGEKIRELRRKNDITQEKLADYLGITYQSISKWENNNGMPDITLIVPIANFFGVSTDELFDRTSAEEERIIEDYGRRHHELLHDGRIDEAVELARDGLQKYPRSYKVMLMFINAVLSGDHGENEDKFSIEAVRMGERILEDCTDSEIQNKTICCLVTLHSFYGAVKDEDKALKYAKMAPQYVFSQDMMLVDAYLGFNKNGELVEQLHKNIVSFMDTITDWLGMGIYGYREDVLFQIETAIKLWNILVYDGNFLWYHCKLRMLHMDAAETAALIGDRERTLEHLRSAMHHAVEYEKLPQERMNFTSKLIQFASVAVSDRTKSTSMTETEIVKRHMNENECYGFIRNDEEFSAISDGLLTNF